MRHRTAAPGSIALALVAALMLAACGGDSTDVDTLLSDLDPTGLQADMQADFGVTQELSATTQTLADALDAVTGYTGVALASGAGAGLRSLRSLAEVASVGAAGAGLTALEPAGSLRTWSWPGHSLERSGSTPVDDGIASVSFGDAAGKTFVYDRQTGSWVEDPARTGAPINGVRIIWYVTDAGGGVMLPLEERGYIDLTPQTLDGAPGLGIRITDTTAGDLVVAEFVETHSLMESTADWSEDFHVVGTMADAASTLDFDVSGSGSGSYQTDASTSSIDCTFASGTRSYTYTLVEDVAAGGTDYTDDLEVTARRNGNTADLAMAIQGTDTTSSGTGTLSVNLSKVADITLSNGDLTFTKPDGSAFSSTDSDRLTALIGMLIVSGIAVLAAIPLVI